MGLLRCREEPPRLLGNRFQERFFLLRGRCLLLLKEKKVRPPRPPRERPGCWVAVRVEPCRPRAPAPQPVVFSSLAWLRGPWPSVTL